MNLVKSWIFAPVDDKILEILLVDGHRGCPSLDQRLLLLNVVGSKPLHFASPEHDIPCSVAKRSMARHTSSCVIFLSLLVMHQKNFTSDTMLILFQKSGQNNKYHFLGIDGLKLYKKFF